MTPAPVDDATEEEGTEGEARAAPLLIGAAGVLSRPCSAAAEGAALTGLLKRGFKAPPG